MAYRFLKFLDVIGLHQSVVTACLQIMLLLLCNLPHDAHGQSSDRGNLATSYRDFYTGSRPIYQSAPVTHVVPEFNTITYSFDGKLIDTSVTPEAPASASHEVLKISGYQASPYLALSLKKFGLGFNLDARQIRLDYSMTGSSVRVQQKSDLTARGLGLFGFMKILDGSLVDLTLIGGGRSVNARHVIGSQINTWSDGTYATPATTFRYTVNSFEAGVNAELHLLRSVSVSPWINYNKTDSGTATSQAKNNIIAAEFMAQDSKVLWQSQKTIDFGIDLALRVKKLELRLGGILGSIFNSTGGNESVKESGYSLSLSIHTKG